MEINASGRFFESYFCDDCGNYLYLDNNYNKNIICRCGIPKIFKNYQEFIEEIPDIASGDELDDLAHNLNRMLEQIERQSP